MRNWVIPWGIGRFCDREWTCDHVIVDKFRREFHDESWIPWWIPRWELNSVGNSMLEAEFRGEFHAGSWILWGIPCWELNSVGKSMVKVEFCGEFKVKVEFRREFQVGTEFRGELQTEVRLIPWGIMCERIQWKLMLPILPKLIVGLEVDWKSKLDQNRNMNWSTDRQQSVNGSCDQQQNVDKLCNRQLNLN